MPKDDAGFHQECCRWFIDKKALGCSGGKRQTAFKCWRNTRRQLCVSAWLQVNLWSRVGLPVVCSAYPVRLVHEGCEAHRRGCQRANTCSSVSVCILWCQVLWAGGKSLGTSRYRERIDWIKFINIVKAHEDIDASNYSDMGTKVVL